MISIKHILPFAIVLFATGCSGNKDGDGPTPAPPVPAPLAATLIFPDNNAICNEGTVISETESTVTFKWSMAENTDSYSVNLTNLDANTSESIPSATNEKSINILRGVPYKWQVVSKSKGTNTTALSSEWKFYNAGLPEESHAPFPSEAISPKMGTSVNAGSIAFKWNTTDVDNDITTYELYLDNINPPTILAATQSTNTVNLEVSGGKIYYWQVIATDRKGNSSQSQVFEFKVN